MLIVEVGYLFIILWVSVMQKKNENCRTLLKIKDIFYVMND